MYRGPIADVQQRIVSRVNTSRDSQHNCYSAAVRTNHLQAVCIIYRCYQITKAVGLDLASVQESIPIYQL